MTPQEAANYAKSMGATPEFVNRVANADQTGFVMPNDPNQIGVVVPAAADKIYQNPTDSLIHQMGTIRHEAEHLNQPGGLSEREEELPAYDAELDAMRRVQYETGIDTSTPQEWIHQRMAQRGLI